LGTSRNKIVHFVGHVIKVIGEQMEGPMGRAMLTIMAAFAQLERDTMIERTRAGLAAAAANGRKGGRPRKLDNADATKARNLRGISPPNGPRFGPSSQGR
jgi:DNA invertase Pin-like site-specific DNA recombinase